MNEFRPPRPRKRFGQNFLTDRNAVGRIVDALEVDSGLDVLEIGPGRGALTAELLSRGARVSAVEVDRDLAARLRVQFAGTPLSVLEADVLEFDPSTDLPDVNSWVLAGNLPYNISKPIVMKLVDWAPRIDRAVLMFQREVAQRLLGEPGSSDYGPLSVLPRELYQIEHLFDLTPRAFRPRPNVHSTVTRWRRLKDAPDPTALARLRVTLRAVFGNRRKTLRNNLRRSLPAPEATEQLLLDAEIDGQRRAETLEREELRTLARLWPEPT